MAASEDIGPGLLVGRPVSSKSLCSSQSALLLLTWLAELLIQDYVSQPCHLYPDL